MARFFSRRTGPRVVNARAEAPLRRGRRWCTWSLGAACAVLLGAGIAGGAAQGGKDSSFYRQVVAARKPPSARALAEQNVLALNNGMFQFYDASLSIFKQNLRDKAPIVLALFTSAGGQWILYRPGQEPMKAPPVPLVYQLAKSISHSSMAIYQLVAPYLDNPSDPSWRVPMRGYLAQCQTALDSLNALDMSDADREVLRAILTRNIGFMEACLTKGAFTFDQLQQFARDCAPYFSKSIRLASHIQVAHWMDVMADWKKLLGKEWANTYAATNALYVTRQNHIFFTILAQFMGREAIGDRLFLFETPAFTTDPDTMLDVLTRVVADRAVGEIFFKDGYVMDAELIGGGARRAIEEETVKRGMQPVMPPLARFKSNAWPWPTDPSTGSGPSSLDQIH
jgi:hypothetical protein